MNETDMRGSGPTPVGGSGAIGSRSSYREFSPAGPTLPGVVCAWEQRIGAGGGYVQRVLPDACADVVVTAGGRAHLVGPTAQAALARLEPGSTVRGLRLRPSAIGPVLGWPADDLRDADADLEDVLPPAEARRLAEQVWGRKPPELRPRRRPDARVRTALHALGAVGAPTASVAGAAEAAGVSERHLRRLVRDATGLDPRELQRVMRLQRFLTLADRGPGRSLAELAVQAGYADQAHMSREVRRMSGLTPKALLRERAAGVGVIVPEVSA
ncbi:helix-turn-helix domain-containing protein [Nocardiopsis sp. RSe5-2]|uniref:Helix-turn-helix domain-containing protein n=1 Tax=Nocardiopsis endophytica TaxID=3018445 RepID=A0ABT4U1D7_9ACTN|nr:helix-turn-helix domain-containing protein [Nocardiopsis endophytica]MDA2810177.1 helix-turn-helix domain-containing protein [Nocardiopsis endophytica]